MNTSEKPIYSKFIRHIPHFTNTHYDLLSPDIAIHLQAIKAHEIATNTEKSPSLITPDLQESYLLREAKARGAIKGSFSQSVIGFQLEFTTASKIWTVFKESLNSADSSK
jgi:hypothetical protein